MSNRKAIVEQLADLIVGVERDHPIRVAIDGVDAAGKTLLADELVQPIQERNRPILRASIDGFHNPKDTRYRQGADSPRGYYQDSFNYDAILRELLIPLGPGGNRIYRREVFDHRADAPTPNPARAAPGDAILLFDGVFLLRPELISHWDFRIYVEVEFDISVPRAVQRDLRNVSGESGEKIYARYQRRYMPGQRLYFEEANPKQRADVIFENNDINAPRITLKS